MIASLNDAFRARRAQPERDAEDEPDADGDDADQQRDAGAGEKLGEDVPPERIGAEPMGRGRLHQLIWDVERRGRIRRPDQRQRRSQHQQRDEDRAEAQAGAGRAARQGNREAHPALALRRGSIAAAATSTTALSAMTKAARPITQFSTTSTSRLAIDCTISRPSPGSTNTFSTTTAPAIRLANCRPRIVRIGGNALGKAWRHSAARRDRPTGAGGELKLFYWDSDAFNNSGSVVAEVTAVPEPGNMALMALALGAFALTRRRKA